MPAITDPHPRLSGTRASIFRSTWLLLAVVTAAWAPALNGQFQFDDLHNIVFDPATAGGAALLERLGNGFRPLLRLSYVLDHRLWGFVPAGFVATNLLLHALTAIGVAALARRRLGGHGVVAIVAAAIFALQPAHAAVVASASGRSTGLATLLMVVALLAHDRGVGGDRRQGWLALGWMTLAVAAKETALVFPALLVLWEMTRPVPPAARVIASRVAPAGILAVALLGIALAGSSRLREILQFSFSLMTPVETLAAHAAALPMSLSLWVRPWALSIEHPQSFGVDAMFAGAIVLASAVAAGCWALRRRPLLALALMWPIVALLPTHGVIARLDPIVEKALYSAWIGPSIALAAVVARWGRGFGRSDGLAASSRLRWLVMPRTIVLSMALSGAIAICAWRAAVWADPAALWREASEASPGSARAWTNRAIAELGAGRLAAAESAVVRALQIDPRAEAAYEARRAISLAMPLARETPP